MSFFLTHPCTLCCLQFICDLIYRNTAVRHANLKLAAVSVPPPHSLHCYAKAEHVYLLEALVPFMPPCLEIKATL